MQTIGERLEEARKRKGISLREASESTKIRSDFLQNIEQNHLDFDLPKVYKQGFIKIYAKYLKLDADSILTECSAQLTNAVNNNKRGDSSELFGSMDSNPRSEEASKPLLGKISTPKKANSANEDAQQASEIDKNYYIKVGLVVLGILTFLFVILGLIVTVLSDGYEPEVDIAGSSERTSTVTPTTGADTGLPDYGEETVSLIASGNVYVLIKQRKDNEKLEEKTLGAGETLDFTKKGPIDVYFTSGENLVIVNPEGKRLKPKFEGTGKISIP